MCKCCERAWKRPACHCWLCGPSVTGNLSPKPNEAALRSFLLLSQVQQSTLPLLFPRRQCWPRSRTRVCSGAASMGPQQGVCVCWLCGQWQPPWLQHPGAVSRRHAPDALVWWGLGCSCPAWAGVRCPCLGAGQRISNCILPLQSPHAAQHSPAPPISNTIRGWIFVLSSLGWTGPTSHSSAWIRSQFTRLWREVWSEARF